MLDSVCLTVCDPNFENKGQVGFLGGQSYHKTWFQKNQKLKFQIPKSWFRKNQNLKFQIPNSPLNPISYINRRYYAKFQLI